MKKRIIIGTFIIITIVLIFIIWNIEIIINLRQIQELKKDEDMYSILTERAIPKEISSDLSTSTIRYQELQFEHVFGKYLGKKDLVKGLSIDFEEEKRILIFENNSGLGMFNIQQISDNSKKMISNYYGEDVIKNDFNLIKKALEVTPDDISWFSFMRNKVLADVQLLLIRGQTLVLIQNEGGIYAFETKSIQGFQQGTPEKGSQIVLYLFDPSGKAEKYYDIILSGSFTQSEIDIMLDSMRFRPPIS